jgi:DnaK suppressor protein
LVKKAPSKARQKKGKGSARAAKPRVARKTAPKRPKTQAKARAKQAARPRAKVSLVARGGTASKARARKPATATVTAVQATPDSELRPVVPAEPPLTPEEIEEFREMLLQKRAQILADMSTLQTEALSKNRRDASGDLSSMPIHMADLGTDNYEQEFTLGLIESERTVLQEIEEALNRIREGTYGLCVATGKPIGKARLRAKPWAKYCYEYALAQEKGQTRGL